MNIVVPRHHVRTAALTAWQRADEALVETSPTSAKDCVFGRHRPPHAYCERLHAHRYSLMPGWLGL